MDGACLPCLAVKTPKWGRTVIDVVWLCHNTLGLPVNLRTTGTVGRQLVLSVHCVNFVPVKSSV